MSSSAISQEPSQPPQPSPSPSPPPSPSPSLQPPSPEPSSDNVASSTISPPVPSSDPPTPSSTTEPPPPSSTSSVEPPPTSDPTSSTTTSSPPTEPSSTLSPTPQPPTSSDQPPTTSQPPTYTPTSSVEPPPDASSSNPDNGPSPTTSPEVVPSNIGPTSVGDSAVPSQTVGTSEEASSITDSTKTNGGADGQTTTSPTPMWTPTTSYSEFTTTDDRGGNITVTETHVGSSLADPSVNIGGSSSSSKAAIAGGVAGGVVALIIGAALVWLFLRRKRRKEEFDAAMFDPSKGYKDANNHQRPLALDEDDIESPYPSTPAVAGLGQGHNYYAHLYPIPFAETEPLNSGVHYNDNPLPPTRSRLSGGAYQPVSTSDGAWDAAAAKLSHARQESVPVYDVPAYGYGGSAVSVGAVGGHRGSGGSGSPPNFPTPASDTSAASGVSQNTPLANASSSRLQVHTPTFGLSGIASAAAAAKEAESRAGPSLAPMAPALQSSGDSNGCRRSSLIADAAWGAQSNKKRESSSTLDGEEPAPYVYRHSLHIANPSTPDLPQPTSQVIPTPASASASSASPQLSTMSVPRSPEHVFQHQDMMTKPADGELVELPPNYNSILRSR